MMCATINLLMVNASAEKRVPSIEKLEGHAAENNVGLHNLLLEMFNLTDILHKGESQTKTDIRGKTDNGFVRFSLKYASLKNTQIWLPTQVTLPDRVPNLAPFSISLQKFLGTTDVEFWNAHSAGLTLSLTEQRKMRVYSDKLIDWNDIIKAFNDSMQDESLINAMMMAYKDEDPIDYLIWINKKSGGIQIVDAKKYKEYLKTNAYWRNPGKGFTTLWCVDKNNGKKLFHLQRKGSGDGKLSCAPMFHIYKHWPESVIYYKDDSFRINT